jgi:hypothetical protein
MNGFDEMHYMLPYYAGVYAYDDSDLHPGFPSKDPGEQYDMIFNGAAPTRGDLRSSPGRYSGQDNGWVGIYMNPVINQFFAELKTHPNIPYQPYGMGFAQMIPPAFR